MNCVRCGRAIESDRQYCLMCVHAAPLPNEEVSVPERGEFIPTSFRDPANLTKWLRYFLYASVCTAALSLFSDVLDYRFQSRYEPGNYLAEEFLEADERMNGNRHLFIGLLLMAVQLPTYILFLIWTYRANFNARQLGAEGMKFSSGWSVGFYFIPILWLWKPYQAMREIWQASKDPSSWKSVKRGAILPWWWFFFLIETILLNQVFKLSLFTRSVEDFRAATMVSIAANAISIPATIAGLFLVMQIYAMQMSHVGKGRKNESGEFFTELH